MKNKKIERYVPYSCSPNEIREQMANIARSSLTLMKTSAPPLLLNQNQDYLSHKIGFYYLYSDIRDWVINQLNQDV